MDVLRAVIVDDEPLAREGLRLILAAEGVEVVGEAGHGVAAVEVVREARPHVVFLDVRMPGLDGFDVVGALGQDAPLVVFVTGYEEHAVRAFRARAVDYVLKPYTAARVREALANARRQGTLREAERRWAAVSSTLASVARSRAPVAEATPSETGALDRLAVGSGADVRLVEVAQVEWIEAADDYVRLHLPGASYLMSERMSTLEERLEPLGFLRVHRSALVNLRAVTRVRPEADGAVAELASGARVRVSRRRRRRLLERLRAR